MIPTLSFSQFPDLPTLQIPILLQLNILQHQKIELTSSSILFSNVIKNTLLHKTFLKVNKRQN